MRATSFLEMAGPKPVPPYLRVVEASAWLKLERGALGSRAGCRCRCLATSIRISAWVSVFPLPLEARTTTSPALVNFRAFPSRLVRICRKRPGSPRNRWGTSVDRAGQLNAISVGTCGHQVQGAFNHFDQVKIEHFEQELARLDLRKIQDVVDDRQ